MHPLLSAIEPGTSAALYLFAIAGLAIAVALVAAGLMARKTDHKAARFYLIASAICCGVAVLLMLIAHAFGKDQS